MKSEHVVQEKAGKIDKNRLVSGPEDFARKVGQNNTSDLDVTDSAQQMLCEETTGILLVRFLSMSP